MMTLRRMISINRNQRGITLIELVIAMAITTLISAAVATGIYQIVKVNVTSANRQIAISQVQNAVNSISRDAEQAQIISPTSNFLSVPLTLQWITWDNHVTVVTYSLSGTTLQRTITIDGSPRTTLVARYITSASGTWNAGTKVLSFSALTATVGPPNTVTETRFFQINPRSAQ